LDPLIEIEHWRACADEAAIRCQSPANTDLQMLMFLITDTYLLLVEVAEALLVPNSTTQ
jgi:hypothetical protein